MKTVNRRIKVDENSFVKFTDRTGAVRAFHTIEIASMVVPVQTDKNVYVACVSVSTGERMEVYPIDIVLNHDGMIASVDILTTVETEEQERNFLN